MSEISRLHSQAHAEEPGDWRAARDRFAELLADAGYQLPAGGLAECIDAAGLTKDEE